MTSHIPFISTLHLLLSFVPFSRLASFGAFWPPSVGVMALGSQNVHRVADFLSFCFLTLTHVLGVMYQLLCTATSMEQWWCDFETDVDLCDSSSGKWAGTVKS